MLQHHEPRDSESYMVVKLQEIVQEEILLYTTTSNPYRGGSRNLKKGGSFKRVRVEHAEKSRVTIPTFAKPRPF